MFIRRLILLMLFLILQRMAFRNVKLPRSIGYPSRPFLLDLVDELLQLIKFNPSDAFLRIKRLNQLLGFFVKSLQATLRLIVRFAPTFQPSYNAKVLKSNQEVIRQSDLSIVIQNFELSVGDVKRLIDSIHLLLKQFISTLI